MKSISELSTVLRSGLERRKMTQAELLVSAGVSQRTLTNVLGGHSDFKVSTLLALADRVGLELVLVPKGAVMAMQAGPTTPVSVPSRVGAARSRLLARKNS